MLQRKSSPTHRGERGKSWRDHGGASGWGLRLKTRGPGSQQASNLSGAPSVPRCWTGPFPENPIHVETPKKGGQGRSSWSPQPHTPGVGAVSAGPSQLSLLTDPCSAAPAKPVSWLDILEFVLRWCVSRSAGNAELRGHVDQGTGRQHWDVCGGFRKSPQDSVCRKRGSGESEDSPVSRGPGKGSGRQDASPRPGDPAPTQEGSCQQHGSLTPAPGIQVRMRQERAFSQTAQLSGLGAKPLRTVARGAQLTHGASCRWGSGFRSGVSQSERAPPPAGPRPSAPPPVLPNPSAVCRPSGSSVMSCASNLASQTREVGCGDCVPWEMTADTLSQLRRVLFCGVCVIRAPLPPRALPPGRHPLVPHGRSRRWQAG